MMEDVEDLNLEAWEQFLADLTDDSLVGFGADPLVKENTSNTGCTMSVSITPPQKHLSAAKSTCLISKHRRKPQRGKLQNSLEKKSNSSDESMERHAFKLTAFPSFKKWNTLYYFSYAMSSHLNCGNIDGLTHMMHSHMDKDCQVTLCGRSNKRCSYRRFLEMIQFRMTLHADGYMCVHSNKVHGHEISAAMYFKHTETRALTESVRRTTSDPEFVRVASTRAETLKRLLCNNNNNNTTVEDEIGSILDSGRPYVVYGKIHMVLTMDSASKKITEMLFDTQVMSLVKCDAVQMGMNDA